jgi:hypothetical protein
MFSAVARPDDRDFFPNGFGNGDRSRASFRVRMGWLLIEDRYAY